MATTSFFKSSGSSATTETNIQTSVDAAEAAKVAAEAAQQLLPQTAEGNAAASQTAAAQSASAAAASEAGSVDFTTNGGTVGGDVTVSGDISVTGNVDGRDVAADGTKLDGIETGATADQTDAEIKTAYENNSDTNAFTDALQTKLNGIEASATADQTAAEIKTAYESNTDTNAFTDADHTQARWHRGQCSNCRPDCCRLQESRHRCSRKISSTDTNASISQDALDVISKTASKPVQM